MQAMESVVSNGVREPVLLRRRFIGSAAILGAGSVIGATVSWPGASVTAARGGRDLVREEIARQMKDNVRALRGPRAGEAARRLAASVRVLAAHQTATGDADLRRRLQALVRRDGREALLRAEADPAMLAAEAREFGFEAPPAAEPFDRAARERALDSLLQQGAGPALLAAAIALEQVAPTLERGGVTAVALRDAEACPNLQAQLLVLELVAIASCLWNPIACAGFQGAYWGLKLSIYLAGC